MILDSYMHKWIGLAEPSHPWTVTLYVSDFGLPVTHSLC